MSMTTNPRPYNHALGEALAFSKDDLDANRAGQVTTTQKERLRSLETKNVLQMIGFSLLMLILAIVFLNVNNQAEAGSALMVILAVIVGITGAALMLRTLYSLWRWQQHANQLQAEASSGPIRLSQFGTKVSENYRSQHTHFFLHTGNQSFIIPYAAFTNLSEGEDYTVYYEPATGHILSIE